MKPGNIMVTKSGLKLLDFGLAKPMKTALAATALDVMTQTPTALLDQAPITTEGTLIGTFQYMSPEQLEGKEADARSDIFALGCVLYEMTTGKRAFDGKTTPSVVAAILASEPKPIATLRPTSPPALDRLIKQCLTKDPDVRWQSANDLKHELEWISQASGEAALRPSTGGQRLLRAKPVVSAIAAALFIAGGATALYLSPRRETSIPTVQAAISIPSNVTHSLAGTEHGKFPFWSGDGKSIGFFADGNLKRLDLAGGPSNDVSACTGWTRRNVGRGCDSLRS